MPKKVPTSCKTTFVSLKLCNLKPDGLTFMDEPIEFVISSFNESMLSTNLCRPFSNRLPQPSCRDLPYPLHFISEDHLYTNVLLVNSRISTPCISLTDGSHKSEVDDHLTVQFALTSRLNNCFGNNLLGFFRKLCWH